jgi:hypothetical protein
MTIDNVRELAISAANKPVRPLLNLMPKTFNESMLAHRTWTDKIDGISPSSG